MAISVKKIVFRDIIMYFALALVICVLSVVSIGTYSYFNFKQLTNQESTNAIKTSFAYEKENLGYINSITSVWTKAYESIVLQYDDKWVEDNIGNDVSKVFGMDLAIILDDKGRVLFSASRGRVFNESEKKAIEGPLSELLQSNKTTRFNLGVVKDLLMIGNKPYMVAIGEVQASYDVSTRLESGKKPKFLVIAQNIDKTLVRNLRKFTLIDSLNFSFSIKDREKYGHLNTLEIANDKEVIGYFVWEPAENAKAILEQILPVSGIAFLILIVLATLIAMNVLRAAASYDDLISNLRITTNDLGIERDKAERSSRDKSKFLATMSHEIRTPMNGIVGILSLLRETELSQQQVAYVNTIQSSSNSLMKLIDDILEFSQSEQKEQTPFFAPVKIRDIVTEIQGLLQPVAIQRGLRFEIFFSQAVPLLVETDSVRFRQILLHLTSNAFKYTKVGHVRINVNTAPLDEGRYELIVQVIDTGAGMPESIRETLFSDFFSTEALNSESSGQGLGLGIAKNLVQLLGGKIDCESKIGQGSVFWFSLPVKKVK
ncbi:MAG: hypothetical protein K2X98_05285 [Alphaproteobacteria bacterium]|nr:hypothetical protein [Alphaproteobacteria bacterium]